MKLVSVDEDYVDFLSSRDREFMQKHGRPCVLVVRLAFRGTRHDFAIPLRSNIAPNVPKDQYYALPPRPTTRPRHRHGIHYIKMFPVSRRLVRRFRTKGNRYYEMLQSILTRNERAIVSSCQDYLDRYDQCGRPRYAVDLDQALALLEEWG